MNKIDVITKQDFLAYLRSIEAVFEETERGGIDFIYVYDKKAYTKKESYVPYMRVSHFFDEIWYTRINGACQEMETIDICEVAERLTKG